MTTILLTGFAPFDGQPVNASWAAVREAAAHWPGPVDLLPGAGAADAGAGVDSAEAAVRSGGPALVARLLPVSFTRAPDRLRELIAEHRPDLVVCVGEAGGRGRVSIERVGLNVQDARIPDEDGDQPIDVPVVPGGPAAHFSTLPVKAALLAVQEAGVPAEVSNTAGTYVCNTVAYALGDQLTAGVRGGFVHVPRLPEQMPAGEPSLPAADAGRALGAILRAALGTGADARVAAGTEA